MARPARRWIMRDRKTNKVVFRGTTDECAKFAGSNSKCFYMEITRHPDGIHKQWYVTEDLCRADRAEAIRNWDNFMRPLRRRYGIPVRRMVSGKAV